MEITSKKDNNVQMMCAGSEGEGQPLTITWLVGEGTLVKRQRMYQHSVRVVRTSRRSRKSRTRAPSYEAALGYVRSHARA